MLLLKDIINTALLQMGEVTTHKYVRAKSYAIQLLRDLKMNQLKQDVKALVLSVQPNKTVVKPQDYVGWVTLGVQVGDRVRPFINNEYIAAVFPNECCDPQPNVSANKELEMPVVEYSWIWNDVYNQLGENIGRIYGYGSGPLYEGFRERDNLFILDSSIEAKEVVLEYISNGWLNDEDIRVPDQWEMTINRYLKWNFALDNPNVGRLPARELEHLYYTELRKAQAFQGISAQEILQIVRDSFKQSPKL